MYKAVHFWNQHQILKRLKFLYWPFLSSQWHKGQRETSSSQCFSDMDARYWFLIFKFHKILRGSLDLLTDHVMKTLNNFGPPKGRSYEFSAVSQSVSDAIPGNLVQEIF